MAAAIPPAGRRRTILIYATVLVVTFLTLLPDIGVGLTAVAERWSFSPLPQSYTLAHLQEVWSNRVSALSIQNSIYYSACSTVLDLVLGITLAWLVVRRPSWLNGLLDGLAESDFLTPTLLAQEYFGAIEAPGKAMVLLRAAVT